MADKAHKDALLRLFRLLPEIHREGFRLDGGDDPAWKELCASPDLQHMTDEEMKTRLRALALVESDDSDEGRAEDAERKARFNARVLAARDELIAMAEAGTLPEMVRGAVAPSRRRDEVIDETDSPAA